MSSAGRPGRTDHTGHRTCLGRASIERTPDSPMPTKPMLPARERNETASQSWHHPVEWAVRSNAKIAVINFAVTNVLSEGHRTVSERHREVTREWTSLSRVQLSQLRGGGCVWQASEIGQDGFQDFDCFCRHAENNAAFASVTHSLISFPVVQIRVAPNFNT